MTTPAGFSERLFALGRAGLDAQLAHPTVRGIAAGKEPPCRPCTSRACSLRATVPVATRSGCSSTAATCRPGRARRPRPGSASPRPCSWVFAPGVGIHEDEATGAAAVRLVTQLGRPIVIRQGAGSLLRARPGPEGSADVGGTAALAEIRDLRLPLGG